MKNNSIKNTSPEQGILCSGVIFSLAPIVIFFILKRISSNQPKKPSFANINKEKIIEGKIIES